MQNLNLEQLGLLAQHDHPRSISIYMPTHRAGRDTQQDPIRLKNLLRKAEQTLEQDGMGRRDIEALLKPAHDLLDDMFFWKRQYDGLALFISEGDLHYHRLPFQPDETCIVAATYYLKPLLPLFTGNGHYYILAISQNELRLFEGTRHSVGQIDLPDDVPANMEEALQYDDPEKELQFHTGTTGAHGTPRDGMFHGHGAGDEDEKIRIENYLNIVDKKLERFFSDKAAPLVLAGVDYMLSMYHQVSDYRHLMAQGVEGNAEHVHADELRSRAWPIVEPHFRAELDRIFDQYHELRTADKATSDVEKIIPAAHYGRVDKLIVAVDSTIWGTFDTETGAVELRPDRVPGDGSIPLTDFAAMQTLQNSGAVYALPKDEMPNGAAAVAVMRY